MPPAFPDGSAGPGDARRRCATARTRTSTPRSTDDVGWPGLAQAEQLHGKEMSYNNYTDADAAWRAAYDHDQTCVAIIKHANPCGIAVVVGRRWPTPTARPTPAIPSRAYGGVIAANRR